jgi:hypothetical protein
MPGLPVMVRVSVQRGCCGRWSARWSGGRACGSSSWRRARCHASTLRAVRATWATCPRPAAAPTWPRSSKPPSWRRRQRPRSSAGGGWGDGSARACAAAAAAVAAAAAAAARRPWQQLARATRLGHWCDIVYTLDCIEQQLGAGTHGNPLKLLAELSAWGRRQASLQACCMAAITVLVVIRAGCYVCRAEARLCNCTQGGVLITPTHDCSLHVPVWQLVRFRVSDTRVAGCGSPVGPRKLPSCPCQQHVYITARLRFALCCLHVSSRGTACGWS